jgi:hypothetical protein
VLLVVLPRRLEHPWVERRRSWQPHGGENPTVKFHDRIVDAVELTSEVSGGHHTEGDCFTMANALVAGRLLEGVGQGVAVVEDSSHSGISLVLRHDLGLDLDAARNHIGEGTRIALEERVALVLDCIEYVGAVNEPV